jgi:hypothetical protein
MVPVTLFFTGITFAFTLYFYYKLFIFQNFLSFSINHISSPELATSIKMHFRFSLFRNKISDLLMRMDLSVCTYRFHSIRKKVSWFVTTYYGTWTYQCFAQLHLCSFAYTEVYLSTQFIMPFTYCSFASIRDLYYLITWLITPWSRVLLDKLHGYVGSQENLRKLWKTKVLYRTKKCWPPVSIKCQIHPVPTRHTHFLKIHHNIILPSRSRSPQWSLSLRPP